MKIDEPQLNPTIVAHADWGTDEKKRWVAKAGLNSAGRYVASAPTTVGDLDAFVPNLRKEVGETGCALLGFDFPIGVSAFYAHKARICSFKQLLPQLGRGEWAGFYRVCDEAEEISLRRPFYPNGGYNRRRTQADLFYALGAASMEPLFRRCERGGKGTKRGCCLFWTLGGNQVGKAAICGWRDVLGPALRAECPVSIWPFDGSLESLLMRGSIVVAETYPAECYSWFSDKPLGKKSDEQNRQRFGESLLRWADENIVVEDGLRKEILGGFPHGQDDAFDAIVGLFGMLKVCLGQHSPGMPNERVIRDIEGWILGRQ